MSPYKTLLNDIDTHSAKEEESADVDKLLELAEEIGKKFESSDNYHAELLQLMERGHRLLSIYGAPEDYEVEGEPEQAQVSPVNKYAAFIKNDLQSAQSNHNIPIMSWRKVYKSLDEAIEDVNTDEISEDIFIGRVYADDSGNIYTNIIYQKVVDDLEDLE